MLHWISMGGAPKASIFMGQGRNDKAEEILGNCFVAQVIISVALTLILLIWNEDLLMQFGASENTIEYATGHMGIYAVGTIFVQLTLWDERLYYGAGIRQSGHVHGDDRGGAEHCPGSDLYLCITYGCKRGGFGHHSVPGGLGILGFEISQRQKRVCSN